MRINTIRFVHFAVHAAATYVRARKSHADTTSLKSNKERCVSHVNNDFLSGFHPFLSPGFDMVCCAHHVVRCPCACEQCRRSGDSVLLWRHLVGSTSGVNRLGCPTSEMGVRMKCEHLLIVHASTNGRVATSLAPQRPCGTS